MGVFKANEVNAAFKEFCPEIDTVHTHYPMKHERWLRFDETFQGEPTFIPCEKDEGVQKNYVFCKHSPSGPGYVSIMCKVSYVNLYTRLMSEGPPGSCCRPDRAGADRWDTACRVVYGRTRASRPDGVAALEQQVDHMAGTKLNSVHGVRL